MKYILHTLLFVLLAFRITAQPISFEKLYSHNVMSYDGVARVLHTNSQETIIAGNAEIGTMGDGECVIVKSDSTGTILNTLVMGKPMYHDVCKDAMQLGTNYFFSGYTRSTDTSASPLFTSFLVKTDDNLNVQWQRNFIFQGNDLYFKAASVTSNGDFLFTGNNYEFSSGNWYTFIMKTDANGMIKFCKMSDGSLSLDPGFITELSNHDILATGSVTLGFEQVMPTAARFDSLGNMIWAKVFDYDLGSVQQSKFIFAKELSSGNILLTGHCDYQSTANIGLMDYQVIKIDSAGSVIWMQTYGAGLIDWLYGADYNPITNELILMGTSQSYTSNGNFNGYIVFADTTGAVTDAFIQGDTINPHQILLYNSSMPGSGNYIFNGVDMMGTAGFYSSKYNPGNSVCNTTNVNASTLTATYPELSYTVTPFPLDVTIVINAVPFDYYTGVNDSLLCFNNATSIAEIQNENAVSFPNPAYDYITFNFPLHNFPHEELKIYNMLGSIQSCKFISSVTRNDFVQITLDVSLLPSGIYIAETGDQKIRFDVIKK